MRVVRQVNFDMDADNYILHVIVCLLEFETPKSSYEFLLKSGYEHLEVQTLPDDLRTLLNVLKYDSENDPLLFHAGFTPVIPPLSELKRGTISTKTFRTTVQIVTTLTIEFVIALIVQAHPNWPVDLWSVNGKRCDQLQQMDIAKTRNPTLHKYLEARQRVHMLCEQRNASLTTTLLDDLMREEEDATTVSQRYDAVLEAERIMILLNAQPVEPTESSEQRTGELW